MSDVKALEKYFLNNSFNGKIYGEKYKWAILHLKDPFYPTKYEFKILTIDGPTPSYFSINNLSVESALSKPIPPEVKRFIIFNMNLFEE